MKNFVGPFLLLNLFVVTLAFNAQGGDRLNSKFFPGQSAANPNPSPAAATSLNVMDMKHLKASEQTKNLKWEKIIVGQDAIDGAALVGIKPNSMWTRLGLQNGDVIIRIDDRELHTRMDYERALNHLTEQNTVIDFKIIRQNQVMQFDYKINW